MYKCLFIIGIIIGVKLKTSDIWKIVDSGMVLLGIFNIFVLYKLKKVFHKEMEKFSLINQKKKTGAARRVDTGEKYVL